MKDRTTIQIPRALKDELNQLKRYKRETYEEIIQKLMKQNKMNHELKNKLRAKK